MFVQKKIRIQRFKKGIRILILSMQNVRIIFARQKPFKGLWHESFNLFC